MADPELEAIRQQRMAQLQGGQYVSFINYNLKKLFREYFRLLSFD